MHAVYPSRAIVRISPFAVTSRRAFTLVEMMVVAVLLTILASLAMAGLAVARQRVRADKTRNTLRKLSEIIVPHYESYLSRRVPYVPGSNARTNALNRLVAARRLMIGEMPDSWADVPDSLAAATAVTVPPYLKTGPILAYAADKPLRTAEYGDAECLYLLVSRGMFEPDVMQQFRQDEIGDLDKDGAPEFIDSWGMPISFFRWAPGFVAPLSPVQFADPINAHDPFDPQRVDPSAYALIPLIVSGGPDRNVGLQPKAGRSWSQEVSVTPGIQQLIVTGAAVGTPVSGSAHLDNITNHDLVRK